MKQFWLGLGLLVAMLVSGIWVTGKMERIHEPAAAKLRQAAQYALAEDWESTGQITKQARKSWEENRRLTAAIVNHEPMDEIDALFAQLEVYERSRDRISCSAACARLSELLDALHQEQGFTWWNLL